MFPGPEIWCIGVLDRRNMHKAGKILPVYIQGSTGSFFLELQFGPLTVKLDIYRVSTKKTAQFLTHSFSDPSNFKLFELILQCERGSLILFEIAVVPNKMIQTNYLRCHFVKKTTSINKFHFPIESFIKTWFLRKFGKIIQFE